MIGVGEEIKRSRPRTSRLHFQVLHCFKKVKFSFKRHNTPHNNINIDRVMILRRANSTDSGLEDDRWSMSTDRWSGSGVNVDSLSIHSRLSGNNENVSLFFKSAAALCDFKYQGWLKPVWISDVINEGFPLFYPAPFVFLNWVAILDNEDKSRMTIVRIEHAHTLSKIKLRRFHQTNQIRMLNRVNLDWIPTQPFLLPQTFWRCNTSKSRDLACFKSKQFGLTFFSAGIWWDRSRHGRLFWTRWSPDGKAKPIGTRHSVTWRFGVRANIRPL